MKIVKIARDTINGSDVRLPRLSNMKISLKRIPISELEVLRREDDPQFFQRTQSKIVELAEGWNDDVYDPIAVSPRLGGGFSIWDGARRAIAQVLLGRTEIVCRVTQTPNLGDQSFLFVESNTNAIKVDPVDIHHASVLYGDKDASTIQDVATELGLEIEKSNKAGRNFVNPNVCGAIGALQFLLGKGGEDYLRDVLVAAKVGWVDNGYRGVYTVPYLRGLGNFLATYTPAIAPRAELLEDLRHVPPMQVLASARQQGAKGSNGNSAELFSRALLKEINDERKRTGGRPPLRKAQAPRKTKKRAA